MRRLQLTIILLSCLLISCVDTFARPKNAYEINIPAKTVSGVIIDGKTKEPLSGVSIQIKGSTEGTSTDANGKFSLFVEEDDVLVISFISYVAVEVSVKGQTTLSVDLNSTTSGLDDVVVVGYGTQKKGDVTSAVASVKSKNFVKGAVRDAGQLIQGKVAGLSVSTSSGDPTATTQIQLRGIATLKASTQPLVLIDGIPGSLISVAPEDIESIDVLKDGSAAAIYGTRGTNGVILITTRKMHGDRTSLEYNSYASVQAFARKERVLDAADYRKYIIEGYAFIDNGTSTDWVKEISIQNPISQTHNITLQSGTRNTNFTASLNYRNWEGMLLRSDNQQLIGRADMTTSIADGKIKINLNVVNRTQKYWTGNENGAFNDYVYRQALIRNPTDSVVSRNGSWLERGVQEYDNPVAYIKETDGITTVNELRLNGNITVTPIRNLHLKLLVSTVKYTQDRGFSQTKLHMTTTKNGLKGYASLDNTRSTDDLLELTADYTKTFGSHKLVALLGGSSQDVEETSAFMSNWDFPTDFYSWNRMQSGNALGRGEARQRSNYSAYTLIGFFGRLNYSYKDKYLAMVSVRQEASSKFGANNKWGNFPAISLGWRVNKESFMSSVGFVNDLKLRAGYGVTGIAPSDSYLSLTSLNYGTRMLYNGTWIQGITPVRNPNSNLKWEIKEEYNFGLDFSLFKNRISGTVDVYSRLTKDMLWDYQVPVPPYLFSSITANVGSISNNGVEVLLNYNAVQKKDFEWTTSVNFSTNTNKLVSLSNDQFKTTNDFFDVGATGAPIQQSTHRVQIGGSIGNFYGYKSIDIDAAGKWIIEDADGKPKPISLSSQADKKVLGNGLPKYYAGWNNTVRFKDWDLSVLMRGAFGFQILNFTRMFYENTKVVQYNMLKSAFDNVYGKTRLTNDLAYVSYYVENGDYWKIDNVTLGYTIVTAKSKVFKGLRVFATGLNLLTITGYKGIDPEVNRGGLAPGNDERNKYPTTRSFTLGFNLNF
jgi:TonB-linked SusC/RagA family outer membrane protein